MPLTIEQAIEHCLDKARVTTGPCRQEHLQLATWLRELQFRRDEKLSKIPSGVLNEVIDVCMDKVHYLTRESAEVYISLVRLLAIARMADGTSDSVVPGEKPFSSIMAAVKEAVERDTHNLSSLLYHFFLTQCRELAAAESNFDPGQLRLETRAHSETSHECTLCYNKQPVAYVHWDLSPGPFRIYLHSFAEMLIELPGFLDALSQERTAE